MKSQKTRLLLVVLGLFIATSSLMIVFATSELNIKSDLANAVQHIEKIIFRENMESEEVEEVTFTNKKNFARINTTGYNVVINNNSDNENKINRLNTEGNTILGGEGNTITSDSKHNVIIAGKNNRIEESSWAVIGGGINNTIKGESHRSVIAGGSGNVVTGRYSSIPGGENNSISGDYSVAMGVNNVVIGDASAALGSGSKIEANNSFLWTDRSHNDVLETDNTFAIVSNKGLVVNGKLPHSYAKLTIGGFGSLVIREGTEVECDTNTKGVMKAVENGDSTCLCSCNGTSWTSLNGGTVCGNACDPLGTSNPKCGNVTKICGDEDGHYVYSGTCSEGKVIDGTGAYFLDKKGKVHRSCQNENGTVTQCEKEPTNDGCDIGARNHCDFSTIVENHIFRTCNTGFVSDNIIEGQLFDNNQLDYVCGLGGVLCAKVCDAGYGPVTEDGMQGCQEKACESREISGYIFPGVPGGADSDATKEGTTTDGSYSCYGIARCELGEFVIPLAADNCTYMCNAGEYSGYDLNSFVGGVHQTKSRSYESGGLTYNCTGDFVCDKGIVNKVEESCVATGGGCPATEIDGYYIGSLQNGQGGTTGKYIEGVDGSCSLNYWCYDNQLYTTDPVCEFHCSGIEPSTGVAILGDSIFTRIDHIPTAWTHVNITPSNLTGCEYTCRSPNVWDDSRGCYMPGCTGNLPDNSIPNTNPPSSETEYFYDADASEPCSYKCNEVNGYKWNSATNKCVKCTGSIPDNAHENNDDLPPDDKPYSYSIVEGAVCTFSCDDNYEWNSSTNKCEPKCIVPDLWNSSDLVIYKNSDQNLTESVIGDVYTLEEAEAAYHADKKCIYVCKSDKPKLNKLSHECTEYGANQCPQIAGESFIGKCELDGGSGYESVEYSDNGIFAEWTCGGDLCCMCSDGSKCIEGLDNRGCEDSSSTRNVEICREVTYDAMHNRSYDYYYDNVDDRFWCGNGAYLVTNIGFYTRTSDFTDEIDITQPLHKTTTTQIYYPWAVLNHPRGGSDIGIGSYNLDWSRYFACAGDCGFTTVYFEAAESLLPRADFGYYSNSLDIDFKDTCRYIVNTIDKKRGTQSYCSPGTTYETIETHTYECGGELPKNAALNDNRKPPMNGENYKCDIYSTDACAYHCGEGYVCSFQGETCVKAHSDVDCGSEIFKCSNGNYGTARGNLLGSRADPYYLSDFFTSWECYSSDIEDSNDPCLGYDDNGIEINTCVKNGCFELKHYIDGGEEWTGWIPTGNLGCEDDYQCRTVSHTVYDEEGYVTEYGGQFVNLCDDYGKVQCYKQKHDFGLVCPGGRSTIADLDTADNCGTKGSVGWMLQRNGDCVKCVPKQCPSGYSTSSDCRGEVSGYAGDKECKKCENLSSYTYYFEGKGDDGYDDCLAEYAGDYNALNNCKDEWCRAHGAEFYPNTGVFNSSQWNCYYYSSQDMCKCVRS